MSWWISLGWFCWGGVFGWGGVYRDYFWNSGSIYGLGSLVCRGGCWKGIWLCWYDCKELERIWCDEEIIIRFWDGMREIRRGEEDGRDWNGGRRGGWSFWDILVIWEGSFVIWSVRWWY